MTPAELKLGLFLPTWSGALNGATPSTRDVVALAQLAEQVGFDAVWVSDHHYYEPYLDYRIVGIELPAEYAGIKVGAWECWTLVTAVAMATTRVEIGTLVTNAGLRNPALFARMVDTVDDLSNGRITLGIGAGDFESEHRAFGYPFERRISRFEEALAIITPLLRGECVNYQGEFHRAEDAALLPKAARAEGPLIMIGTLHGGPRMTRLVAQYADMWNCILAFGDCGPASYLAAWERVRMACEKHGRDPATVIRHATVAVNLTNGEYPIPGSVPLSGAPDSIAQQLAEFAAMDVQHVSVMPHPWDREGIVRFADVLDILRR